jgi:hypothetical protein
MEAKPTEEIRARVSTEQGASYKLQVDSRNIAVPAQKSMMSPIYTGFHRI